jgi:hypothetical protein
MKSLHHLLQEELVRLNELPDSLALAYCSSFYGFLVVSGGPHSLLMPYYSECARSNLESAINACESECYYILSVLSVSPVSVYSSAVDLIRNIRDRHHESMVILQMTDCLLQNISARAALIQT